MTDSSSPFLTRRAGKSGLLDFLQRPPRRPCIVEELGDDPVSALQRLSLAGEKFDGFVFSGVLEAQVDPVRPLALAKKVATPDAALVAAVPNVGYLPLARDLLAGRLDGAWADSFGVSRLRWFDRRLIQELLVEAGWWVERVEGVRGFPPEAELFLAQLGDWPRLDRTSLWTRSWVAVARAGEGEVQSANF